MPCSAADLVGPVLAATMLAGCAAGEAAAPAPPAAISAPGRIDAAGEARYLVAERDGVIAAVHVRPGDRVVRGQALVQLNCGPEEAAVAAAQAAADAAAADRQLVEAGARREVREAARARLVEAETRAADAADLMVRAEALRAQGFVSTRRLEQLASERKAADARADAARAEWQALATGNRPEERARARAGAAEAAAIAAASAAEAARCVLRAPVDGHVLQVTRREGEFSGASAGQWILAVGDLGTRIVRAEIADRDSHAVAVGDAASVWIDGDPRRWQGRVARLSGLMGRRTARTLDPTDRFDRDTLEAIIAFDGAPPPAIVGLRVNVEIPA